MKAAADDKRVERTRQALFGAFFELVTGGRYDEMKVDDIVRRAGVGRSTFYEHFKSKDDLLAESLKGPFGLLADVIRPRDNTPQLIAVLEHFWENRRLAQGIFTGPIRPMTVGVLVRLIEERFKLDRVGSPNPLVIPQHLAAVQLAEGLLAPVTAWLSGESPCKAEVLAPALRQTAIATLQALQR